MFYLPEQFWQITASFFISLDKFIILYQTFLLVASVTSELPLNMIKKLMANEANMKQELLSKDIKSETMLEDLMMERRFQS